MRDEPNLAAAAALIGDPSRATMLAALVDGRALPAGELAAIAGLSLSGASAHLARLLQGGLIALEREGRHRYYRLAGPQVAAALETLAALAVAPLRPRSLSPAAAALRRGRTCYDHLAGELGVTLAERLEERGFLAPGEGKRLRVTAAGEPWFAEAFGIETSSLRAGRHGVACRCLDWTERRHHVAGPLGAAMLHRCRELKWVAKAGHGARAIKLTSAGAEWMRQVLNVTLAA
ncbi:helix-turn-helix transcriptional regulator [Methylocapsa sp. S129]|uniref:ArsR/SmtB family transcription factor n=1 Tax=Methylocapsa sp. S129 TaxID=1641869 RepID=UPI00131BBAD3|nr:metalloregulator ArsR/SmtB family transcription factor [Methylocapsa sp. S129]